ncbi:MAG: hypothetical protein ACRD2W_21850 [Acidimicrobiales bacterium]
MLEHWAKQRVRTESIDERAKGDRFDDIKHHGVSADRRRDGKDARGLRPGRLGHVDVTVEDTLEFGGAVRADWQGRYPNDARRSGQLDLLETWAGNRGWKPGERRLVA